jgi:hypothetical protein
VNAGWQASSSWTLDDSLSYGLMAWPDPQMPGQAWFWPLSHSGPAATPGDRQHLCMSEGIRTVRLAEINFGAVAHRAMWGYLRGARSLPSL